MNEIDLNVTNVLNNATGSWSGQEQMADPSGGTEPIHARAAFENKPALGGSGMTGAHHQQVGDTTTMHCQTTYRFDPDGGVLMTWIPSSGDACIFRGSLRGSTIRVSRTDEQGLTHRIESDYGTPGVVQIKATIASEEMPEMEVFTGHYELVQGGNQETAS